MASEATRKWQPTDRPLFLRHCVTVFRDASLVVKSCQGDPVTFLSRSDSSRHGGGRGFEDKVSSVDDLGEMG